MVVKDKSMVVKEYVKKGVKDVQQKVADPAMEGVRKMTVKCAEGVESAGKMVNCAVVQVKQVAGDVMVKVEKNSEVAVQFVLENFGEQLELLKENYGAAKELVEENLQKLVVFPFALFTMVQVNFEDLLEHYNIRPTELLKECTQKMYEYNELVIKFLKDSKLTAEELYARRAELPQMLAKAVPVQVLKELKEKIERQTALFLELVAEKRANLTEYVKIKAKEYQNVDTVRDWLLYENSLVCLRSVCT